MVTHLDVTRQDVEAAADIVADVLSHVSLRAEGVPQSQ
jgi:hypothetical protein